MAVDHRGAERRVFKAMGWRRTWKEDWDGEGEDCDETTCYGELKSERMKGGYRAVRTLLEKAWDQLCLALERAAVRAEAEGRPKLAAAYRSAPKVAIHCPTGTNPEYALAFVDGTMYFLRDYVEQVCKTKWIGDDR